MIQPLLFAAKDLPEMATPVPIGSREWADGEMRKKIEGILFNAQKLAAFEAKQSDGRELLNYVLRQFGGRAQ